MPITLDQLKAQSAQLTSARDQAFANGSACQGGIQLCQLLIAQLEKEALATPVEPQTVTSGDPHA